MTFTTPQLILFKHLPKISHTALEPAHLRTSIMTFVTIISGGLEGIKAVEQQQVTDHLQSSGLHSLVVNLAYLCKG